MLSDTTAPAEELQNKLATLEQIVGRIAAHGQLGKNHQVGSLGLSPIDTLLYFGDVSVEVVDMIVELR